MTTTTTKIAPIQGLKPSIAKKLCRSYEGAARRFQQDLDSQFDKSIVSPYKRVNEKTRDRSVIERLKADYDFYSVVSSMTFSEWKGFLAYLDQTYKNLHHGAELHTIDASHVSGVQVVLRPDLDKNAIYGTFTLYLKEWPDPYKEITQPMLTLCLFKKE